MRNYLHTTTAGLVHLGSPVYNSDEGSYDVPAVALCGVAASEWSTKLVEPGSWALRDPATVCPTCDRTALWQAIISLDIT